MSMEEMQAQCDESNLKLALRLDVEKGHHLLLDILREQYIEYERLVWDSQRTFESEPTVQRRLQLFHRVQHRNRVEVWIHKLELNIMVNESDSK
jgi:hypothetical protein